MVGYTDLVRIPCSEEARIFGRHEFHTDLFQRNAAGVVINFIVFVFQRLVFYQWKGIAELDGMNVVSVLGVWRVSEMK